jgi:hypothetical protein
MTSSHTDREVSDVVERVAKAVAAEIDAIDADLQDTVNEQTQDEFRETASRRIAEAALEASHHAELVGALKHIRELLVAYGPRYIEKATRLADAVLAKIGGAK